MHTAAALTCDRSSTTACGRVGQYRGEISRRHAAGAHAAEALLPAAHGPENMLCTPLPSSPQLPPAQLHLCSGTVCGANPVLLHGGRGLRLGTLCRHLCWAHSVGHTALPSCRPIHLWVLHLWPASCGGQTGPQALLCTRQAQHRRRGCRQRVPGAMKFRAPPVPLQGRTHNPASPCFFRLVHVRAFTVRAHVSNRWLRSQLARNPAPSSGPGRQASRSTHSVILPV